MSYVEAQIWALARRKLRFPYKGVLSIKRKMAAIIGGTLFTIAGGTLPMFGFAGGMLASATITNTNTNGQHQMIAKKLPQPMVSYLTPRQEEMTVALEAIRRGVEPSTVRRQPR